VRSRRFLLPESPGAKIATVRPHVWAASEVIHLPSLSLDFEACIPQRNLHGQISVRIPGELRARL
jgi:hypothetical protein